MNIEWVEAELVRFHSFGYLLLLLSTSIGVSKGCIVLHPNHGSGTPVAGTLLFLSLSPSHLLGESNLIQRDSLSLILATGFDRFISVAHAAAVRCPSAQWHQIRRNERERGRTKEEGRGGGERAYEGVGIARSPLLLSRTKRLCFFL